MEEIHSDRHLVLWDGACGFCGRVVEWCEVRDTAKRLQFLPYQDAPRPPMDDALEAACANAVHVLSLDGRRLRAGRAILFIYAELGWRSSAGLASYPPFIWAVEFGYWLVARNRMFFSRYLFN
jgi:predicted DCC family thiol-disulfide oxidoreductase YuxK